jgi:glycosyltransferase involved in cell wall biosynthesis
LKANHAAPRVLIISQSVSLPSRRRTWQQAVALAERGWDVRVICPRRQGEARREVIQGVTIARFRRAFEGASRIGIVGEYILTLCSVALLVLRIRAQTRIDVVQTVNPPDWLHVLVAPLRALGCRTIFDFTDLSTALYRAKFGRKGSLYGLVAALQRKALRDADLVIAANDVYRRIAERAGRPVGSTITVHSYAAQPPKAGRRRRSGRLRLGYFGVIGRHDGVDTLLHATRELVTTLGAGKISLIVVGAGPALPELQQLSLGLGLEDHVQFCGYLSGETREAVLDDFDIAIIPDPLNCYTRSISMNKLFVYAAHGLAIVSTPLPGSRRLLREAALFAEDSGPSSLATAILRLARDSILRRRMRALARRRAEAHFDWDREAKRYVQAVEALLRPRAALGRLATTA